MRHKFTKISLDKINNIPASVHPIINSHYYPYMLQIINSAKDTIDILTFAGKYYPGRRNNIVNSFWHALARAAYRGVKIRLLLNSNFYKGGSYRDNKFIYNKFNTLNFDIYFSGKSTRLHSKLFIIDHSITIIGSHNLSQRALNSNFETSIAIYSTETANIFLANFNRLWKSRQLLPEATK